MKKIVAFLLLTAMVFGLCACGGKSSVSFETLEPAIDNQFPNAYCRVGSDGSYMSFDSNPLDTDSDDLTDYENDVLSDTIDAIEYTCTILGFNDALFQKMLKTTSKDGLQQEQNESYSVRWSYHPDKGIEVMFEKNS